MKESRLLPNDARHSNQRVWADPRGTATFVAQGQEVAWGMHQSGWELDHWWRPAEVQ